MEEKKEQPKPEENQEQVSKPEENFQVASEDEKKEKSSKISNDESTYSLEEGISSSDGDSDQDENDDLDLKHYDAFSVAQIKEEAMRLLKDEPDLLKVRTGIVVLRELYEKHIEEERKIILQAAAEDDEEIQKDALKSIEKKEKEFAAIWALFKEKRKEYFAKLEQEKEDNYNKKLSLLEELKTLINSGEPLKKTFDEFNVIQGKWREIGMVPKDKNNELWLNYNHFVGLFLEKVNMYHELRDLDKKKNLELKIELCEKAEALILAKLLHESFKKLQDLHVQWKEIGPVPVDQSEELWQRFKTASEKIREARITFYEEQKKKQKINFEAKTALLEKARILASAELNTIKEWNAQTKEINELYQLWRSIGRAPKENNDKVWSDFKGILDSFFTVRKEFFAVIRQEYDDNYNKKLNICMQVEAVQESTEWTKTANELKRLQGEWKKIGPAPRAKSDAIWKRFRAACDHFFNNKNDYYKNLSKNEAENFEKKQILLDEFLKHKFVDDKKENLNTIHEYQRKWVEIGRVPFEKKDEIQQKWRKQVDDTLDKLKISRFESDNKRFKERIEKLSESKGGQYELNDEVRKLKSRISKLQQDVLLWENNLSFFSSSKNADILLKEYHDKIDKAKIDIKVMKEKQKFLNAKLNK